MTGSPTGDVTGGTVPTPLTDRLCALAREAGPRFPAPRGFTAGEAVVLADRPDGTVVGFGGVVAKAHPPGTGVDTDVDELTVRLRIAAHPRLAGILLPPLVPGGIPASAPAEVTALRLACGRLATLWPRGTAVAKDAPEDAPWQASGALLARLHSVPPDVLTDAM
ncbi:MAG TPA: hypothetical protein VGO89_00755, partial [Streptomyces sp.]|nr:hypothetical protein [Streptomyces sp.]